MAKIGVGRGMSLTTSYLVKFGRKGGSDEAITLFCDEAQLPNVQAATAQIAGRYTGEGPYQYPHTRLFTDISLGFLCDAQLTQLKFFQQWYDDIFNSTSTYKKGLGTPENMTSGKLPDRQRVNRLKFPAEYTSTTWITKVEQGPGYDRPTITYILENSYPYAIDAVPLSYGSSQVTRVNVNFHYVRHSIIYNKDTTPLVRDKTLFNSDFADNFPTTV